MEVAAVRFDLRLPGVSSLKEKRSVVRPLVEGARRRFGVSAAEVADHDLWQRASVGVAVVAPDVGHAETLLRRVEDFVWSHPELEVVSAERFWLET
jgi:hypothetical protein